VHGSHRRADAVASDRSAILALMWRNGTPPRCAYARGLAAMPIGSLAMYISEICTHDVVTCARDSSVQELAQLMRDRHVGDVVVVDRGEAGAVPVGIVTDRDIVVRVVAKGLDVDAVTASDLMGEPLTTAFDSEGVYDAIWRMRNGGIRRLPVIDARGVLLGVVTMDDIAAHLATELADVVRIVPSQGRREQQALCPAQAEPIARVPLRTQRVAE
jgi:CBS domain-containing protein